MHKNNNNKLKFIDLFAGIGAMRSPFSKMGDLCLFTSEIDKYAQKTYKIFYNEEPAGDITQIEPDSLPDADLLLAGFPCQSFSTAGLCKGFNDDRGQMFFYIERILKAKNYPIVFLENVKNLAHIQNGEVLKYILNSLSNLGYFVKYKIIKANDFGNLQPRERIYILAFKDVNLYNNFEFPNPPKSQKQAILNDFLDAPETIAKKYWITPERLAKIKAKNAHYKKLKYNNFSHKFNKKTTDFIWTFTTVSLTSTKTLILENEGGGDGVEKVRKLTPVEAARVQGIDADLIKKSQEAGISDHQLYRQIGNSVAVVVIEAIAKSLKQAITKTQAQSKEQPKTPKKSTNSKHSLA